MLGAVRQDDRHRIPGGDPLVAQARGGYDDDGTQRVSAKAVKLTTKAKVKRIDYTITVDAGCILQNVQHAAADADRLFPLSLGAEGSCQIGGNISTNAGGINTLRYGNMRDLVLGVEVVLPVPGGCPGRDGAQAWPGSSPTATGTPTSEPYSVQEPS